MVVSVRNIIDWKEINMGVIVEEEIIM